MSKILFVHWNEGEAVEYAKAMEALGNEVATLHEGGKAISKLKAFGPEAIVISLERLPSHGRAVAAVVRNRKSTRQVPLIFAGGAAEKVAALRAELPDAEYTSWARLAAAIKRALKRVVENPVTPSVDICNPSATVARKLGIQSGVAAVTMNAPDSFERALGGVPDGASIEADGRGPADLVILFCESEAELTRDFRRAVGRLVPKGKLWIAWPKKAGKVRTDLDFNIVRAFGLAHEWVDYKICSIDARWSASAFARRRKDSAAASG